jgi:hypothetical protein
LLGSSLQPEGDDMIATIQFQIETTQSADATSQAVRWALTCGGCPVKPGTIRVSIEAPEEPRVNPEPGKVG